ncbi:MAG: universal stress protein [Fimbriimonadales bacterium]|nr:universal stress protein [Fimbriimonadales bacterium]
MMRIVVGVDGEGAYQRALAWIDALGFEQPHLILASVIEPPRPPVVGVVAPFPDEVFVQAMQAQEEAARQRLSELESQLQAQGVAAESVVRFGQAGAKLLELADERDAEMIALGGTSKGALQAFLVGSAARTAITNARQSLLIAHTPPNAEQPLHAVIATDHSDYNYRCLDLLLQFVPRKLQRIAVATAFDLDEETLELLTRNAPAVQQSGADWIIEQLHERNRQVCERLRPLQAACESLVVEGLPIPSLREAMRETNSQLLILGAKGHGLIERLSLGSVSYHFAVGERVNLLILRAPEA